MTATMLPPTDAALAELNRQIAQVDDALRSGVHGWAVEAQDERRRLLERKADLLGVLGKDSERLALLHELALSA